MSDTEFRFTDKEWREYQSMPEQGYSHRHKLEFFVNRWLAAHDAEAARKALEDAADEFQINTWAELLSTGNTIGKAQRVTEWLRARAAAFQPEKQEDDRG